METVGIEPTKGNARNRRAPQLGVRWVRTHLLHAEPKAYDAAMSETQQPQPQPDPDEQDRDPVEREAERQRQQQEQEQQQREQDKDQPKR